MFQTRNAELADNRRMEFRIGMNLGDVIDEEAREVAAEHRKLRPPFSLKDYKKSIIYKDPKVTEELINQLRKAGFPD